MCVVFGLQLVVVVVLFCCILFCYRFLLLCFDYRCASDAVVLYTIDKSLVSVIVRLKHGPVDVAL